MSSLIPSGNRLRISLSPGPPLSPPKTAFLRSGQQTAHGFHTGILVDITPLFMTTPPRFSPPSPRKFSEHSRGPFSPRVSSSLLDMPFTRTTQITSDPPLAIPPPAPT